jgi:hypothetical protein
MNHSGWLTLSLVGCFLLPTARAEQASEQTDCASTPACKSIYLQARQQSEQANLGEALRLYRAAYEVRADPTILFSIARVLHKGNRSRRRRTISGLLTPL